MTSADARAALPFRFSHAQGFWRVAVATPIVHPARTDANACEIIALARMRHRQRSRISLALLLEVPRAILAAAIIFAVAAALPGCTQSSTLDDPPPQAQGAPNLPLMQMPS